LGLVVLAAADPVLRINRPQVTIRSDATPQSPKVAVLRQGDEVELLRRKGDWFQVRLADGRNGWVHTGLVQERLIVEGTGELNIRAGAGAGFPVLAKVYRGAEFGKLRQQGTWYEVETDDGQTGWVLGKFAQPRTRLSTGTRKAAPRVEERIEEEPAAEATQVKRNPYAEGLLQESEGNYRAALESFAAARQQDSGNVNILIHAALAHKELVEYELALTGLYEVQETSPGRREVLRGLAEVYELKAETDSARKYQALYRGEEVLVEEKPAPMQPAPAPAPTVEPAPWSQDLLLYLGVVAGASLAILLVLLLLRGLWRWLRRNREPREPAPRGKFARMVKESQVRPTSLTRPSEEQDLDRKIEEKWQELRASASAFLDPDALAEAGPGELEQAHTDQLLGHLETLRQTMETQEQRARLYADIVRLQNLKIEAMEEEVRLLRRQRRKG
jgi:SH3-like domain-containing protein